MKQPYHTPRMELFAFSNEDVITTSLTAKASGVGNSSDIDCSDWLY